MKDSLEQKESFRQQMVKELEQSDLKV
jgi:hypothetical protein